MLEVFVNFICAFILAIIGFYFIRKIRKSNEKMTLQKMMIFALNGITISIVRSSKVSFYSSIIDFIINTITYKIIFKQSTEESIIETGILSLFVISSDALYALIVVHFFHFIEFKHDYLIYILINILIALTPNIILTIKPVSTKANELLKALIKKDLKMNGLFIFLIMLAISGLVYNIIKNYNFNIRFIGNMTIIGALVFIGILFSNSKDGYNKLSDQYDVLLQNVQTFEEWIEREQFTRHEYKNQLAVLYAMSSEKEVKNKIEEIINQNLNIKNEVVNNLKDLPKGGLKGLLYYKTIIAEKNKLKVTVDISIKPKGILSKLSKEKINTISKIIGIYYDNAIEAAKESRKKTLLFEIYELKDKVNIVISNTFKKSSLIDNHFEKGISSKGSGHGNGLYYASRILKANNWLEQKQEIIDNYYVETIRVKKDTSKK